MVEVGSVVDGGLVGRGATKDFGSPGVEVGVEVEDGDGPVGAVDGAEERESDGVVAAEGDESGQRFAGFRVQAWFVGVSGRGAGEKEVVSFFDLFEGIGVIVTVHIRGQLGSCT